MRKDRKACILLLVVVCIAALLAWGLRPRVANTSKELLENGDFSVAAKDGLPDAWYADAYIREEGYTSYELIDGVGPEGQRVVHITNHEQNDARVAQQVAVEPDSLYCLSGLIKAKTEGGRGANLSIGGVYSFSDCLYDTEGEWEKVALWGRTDSDQYSLTVFARLGGYSGETLGEAWFTDISLKRVSEAPAGVEVQNLFLPSYQQSSAMKLDLRHGLLAFFILLYGMLLIGFVRGRSMMGMLLLITMTTVMSAFATLLGQTSANEMVLRYTTPLPWMKYVFWGMNLLTCLMAMGLVHNMARRGDPIKVAGRVQTEGRFLADEHHNARRPRRLDWKDWVVMILISVAYAGLTYTNLGSTASPQTPFVFEESAERVIFDLGEYKEDFRMLYIGGVHQSQCDFTVQISDDGRTWNAGFNCGMNEGMLYQWKYVNGYNAADQRSLSGRYVQLTAQHRELTLLETLFRDAEGNVLPVTARDSLGRDVSALTDEQDMLKGEPSWYNSMYFDEIYHARTAYEHLHGLQPYEVSHPPLGKVLMSWGIAAFGMTPFGWRFAGATCGVMMLPGMYMLGKLLFAKRRYAMLPCLMMALDTMHFTQTRIATIDSYVVLFIIWAVYFMLRWFYTDFFGQKLWKTMIPLAMSGLFMGLAVASKWPGCYAGVGLAVVFFFGIWRRWKAVGEARTLPRDERDDRACAAAEGGGKRLLITMASCLVFFVLVPLMIYWCSYIPYFAPSGGVTVQRIVDAAEWMLWYHSQPGHGMDHPYYSPWYQWPLSERPMCYVDHNYTPDGYTYSIAAFGNYAVWWVGFLALCVTIYAYGRHQLYPVLCHGYRQSVSPLAPEGERDERPALLVICFAAQFVPWLLVPRGTYIYHYFPSVPFIILCTAYVMERLNDWWATRAKTKAENSGRGGAERAAVRADRQFLAIVAAYLLVVAVMFAAFFPMASGIMVRREWMDAINWFHHFYY